MESSTNGLVIVSIAPMRAEPSHRSEQVSELLFGEQVKMVFPEGQHEWVWVQNEWDNYEGWILRSQLMSIPKNIQRKKLHYYSVGTHDVLNYLQEFKGCIRLSPGSNLIFLKRNKIELPKLQASFKGKRMNLKNLTFSEEQLDRFLPLFLGVPYKWGGRSINGIDCSGLSQVLFKLQGKRIPRDASQQAKVGEEVHFLQDARKGDLAFFSNPEGKINHVGILLDSQNVLHCSEINGRVCIDAIDSEGIISRIHKIRTHSLRLIKRYN